MLIQYNQDDWETVTEHHVCDYHKEHPGVRWPGCTCLSTISQRKKVKNISDKSHKAILEESLDKYDEIWTELAHL